MSDVQIRISKDNGMNKIRIEGKKKGVQRAKQDLEGPKSPRN